MCCVRVVQCMQTQKKIQITNILRDFGTFQRYEDV